METIVPNVEEEQPQSSKANEKRVFACRNNCDAEFESFKLLNRHILTEHREVVENKLSKCKYCDKRTRKKLMIRHVQNEHSLCKVEGCDERLPLFALKAHMFREHGNDYVHNLKETMKKKKKKKKKDAVRKCPVTDCNREFKKNMDLKKHMMNNHTEEENLGPCEYEGCNQTLLPWAIKQHILKEHAKQFEKECRICKYVCTSKQGWNKHRKKHINEYFNQKNGTANTDLNEENTEKCDDSEDEIEDDSENESEESSDDDEPIEKKKRSFA